MPVGVVSGQPEDAPSLRASHPKPSQTDFTFVPCVVYR